MIEQVSEIIFNEEVTKDCFLMGFKSANIAAEARPGQFVMIQVGPGTDPLLRRPFSICRCREDGVFLILYKVVGRGTRLMSRVKKGDRLSVIGPLGNGFILPEDPIKPLLVSGGMGIAPLLFLCQALETDDTIFMAGYRLASEIIDIRKIGLPHLKILTATEDGLIGHHGLVTELLEAGLHESDEERLQVFACGPVPMLRQVADITLRAIDLECQVSLESPMACGVGACQGCAIKASSEENRTFFSVCRDGPVFDARTLDWKSL